MKIDQLRLKSIVQRIFQAGGCNDYESGRIAHYLVESNLVGHDSHGVIRVSDYIRWLKEDRVRANQSLQIVLKTDVLAVVDGQFGFGQVMGEKAIELGVEMAKQHGIAIIALRNSAHLGRIGDWPLLAAQAGLASLHFVNTSGFGLLVAPFGGIDRRLSANPIAAGVPVAGRHPMILDISTSAIAEGKLKVAKNKGEKVPPGCILTSDGTPTDDPAKFYTTPPGTLLPFGGHKGYGLSVFAEIFAGALTGNGCSNPSQTQRLLNGMLSILVNPDSFPREFPFADEVTRFIEFVKSSRRVSPTGEILMPGDVEELTRQARVRDGIQIDDVTWTSIVKAGEQVGITAEEISA